MTDLRLSRIIDEHMEVPLDKKLPAECPEDCGGKLTVWEWDSMTCTTCSAVFEVDGNKLTFKYFRGQDNE
jgi:hypothetical protein